MDHALRERYFQQLDRELRELLDPKTGLLSEVFSRKINCPLCEALPSRHEMLFVKNGYTFVRCIECGMIFVNPQVKETLLNEFYGKSEANDLWVQIQKSEKEKAWKKDYYLDALKIITTFVDKPKIKMLDIGCSAGYFLEIVRKAKPSWESKGLELCELAYKESAAKGFQVHKKLLHELPTENKFNLFTMFGVLEHLSKPRQILESIKNHADPGLALVFAVTPNAYSLYHMFLQEVSRSFDGRNHLLYFSEKTLVYLFESAGFEILHLDTCLSGLDNIKRQIQWYEPNSTNETEKYIPQEVKRLFEKGLVEKFIFEKNLGLRLRILAKIIK